MAYSMMTELSRSRSVVDVFGGYNHNLRINDGEFYEMRNLTPSYYPVMSPRGKRGNYAFPEGSGDTHKINGIIAKDALCYVDGTKLYVDNYLTGLTLEDSPKQLISMGAYIIIMPDKKYINTSDLTDFGNIEATFTTTGNVSYSLCNADGEDYSGTVAQSDEPKNEDGTVNESAIWIDTSSKPHTLKQYSSVNSMWVQIPTTYVKISSPNIASNFNRYDGVKISGIDTTAMPQLADFDGKISVLYDVRKDEDAEHLGQNDYIVIVGIIDAVGEQESTLTIERLMPKLDFITESGNRLWGCRYGKDNEGNVVNEIYASKLGDFKNWNCFMGTSTDSYTASCGTDGQWTGAVTHLGYPLFFKENCLHKVYGNFPSNFQIQTTACRGVMKGAGLSLAIVNELLFYKSRNGVCVYDGSLPSEISSAFGDEHFSGVDENQTDILRNGAVAGSHNNRYYISMKSEINGKWYLFVYDTASGMWFKEDNTRVDAFCSCRGELWFIDHETQTIRSVFGSGIPDTGSVKWSAETGVLGTSMPDKKYISSVLVRMSLETGSEIMFSAQYDSCGEWEHLATLRGTNLRTFTLPLKPKRCDHFRIRFEGTGGAKIYSITKTIEQGSDF